MSNLKTEHEIEIDQIHDRQLAEKDAEIARLKARVEALRQIREEDKTLITELCDAIERVNYSWPNDYDTDLLQRAREATR